MAYLLVLLIVNGEAEKTIYFNNQEIMHFVCVNKPNKIEIISKKLCNNDNYIIIIYIYQNNYILILNRPM